MAQDVYLVTERELQSATVNAAGELEFTRENGQKINAGKVRGDITPEAIAARDAAVSARDAAVAAKNAAQAVGTTNDTIMAPILADPSSASGAQLRDTIGGAINAIPPAVADGTRWIPAGDSLTSLAGGGAPYMGWATQATMISQGAVRMIRNAGVPGDNASDLRARLDADVIAHKPNLVSVWVGTNDITQGRTFAAYQNDMTAIVSTFKRIGAAVVLFTIPPRADSSKAATISAWNAWLKSFARDNSLHLIDAHAILAAPSSTTFKAGYDSGDGIHISQAGHNAVAKEFTARILPRLVASEPLRPISNLDPNNLLTNGLLLTNADGSPGVPDGWLLGGDATGFTESIVDDADFHGGKAWQVAAKNPTAFREFLQNAAAEWAAGDELLFLVKVKVISSSGVPATAGLSINCNFFGSTGVNPAAQNIALGGLLGTVAARFVVPPATTTVQLDCLFNPGNVADVTYRVGELAIYNLTRMGAV